MLKVLFNCSTNVIGGGLKNAVLFIENCMNDSTFDWFFAVPPQVIFELEKRGSKLPKQTDVFINSPAKNFHARRKIKELCIQNDIHLTYTMAGPAYVKIPCYHIQGLSNPYITHADLEAFALKGSYLKIAKYYLRTFVQFLYSRKADFFVFQTEQARSSYIKRLGTNEEKSTVIPNAFDESMLEQSAAIKESQEKNKKHIIFCPGANYKHKGFQFIPSIAAELKNIGFTDCRFRLTLKEDNLLRQIKQDSQVLGVEDMIENIGPYNYSEVTELYSKSTIVFVPSLLETFSASYLEAIVTKKPLLVAEKPFAREVCQNYATYCNPGDSRATAFQLSTIFQDLSISEHERTRILNKFGNQSERFNKIIKLINDKVL